MHRKNPFFSIDTRVSIMAMVGLHIGNIELNEFATASRCKVWAS
ncbi:hypothetical protein [Yersinia pekkanenii]|nr:hypothetical protein [Yersinia pekkanenii]